jgi:hypothetical protein
MKQIEPKVIQGKTATQMAINMVGNPCELGEDSQAQVSWQLLDGSGSMVSFGSTLITGQDYTNLSTGDYYANVWNFVCETIDVVVI